VRRGAPVVLLALAAPWALGAQQPPLRRVTGMVVSRSDSSPVAGASVAIIGTALRTTSGADGRFVFPRAPAEMLDLVAARIGYTPELASVPQGAANATVTITLVANPIQIAPVVVSATRDEQLASNAPVSVSVATAGDIARRATQGIDEAVALVPGVELLDGQISIRGSSGYARGVGSRVLLLVDGVPANEGDRNGIDWDLLPLTEIERVEVVKGTASALYGSSALGGVVNVITRPVPAEPRLTTRLVVGGYAAPPYGAWRWRTTPALFGGADLGYSRRVGPVGVLLAGGALGNGGYRENNDDQRAHGLLKLVFAPSAALHAELLGAAAHDNHGQVLFWCVQGQCADSGLAYQPFRVDSTARGDRTRSDKLLVQATARRVLRPDLALRGRLSWLRTSFRDIYRADSDAATADRVGGEVGAEWHPGPRRVLHAGTEVTYSTVASDLFGDHSQTALAWYAEDESALGAGGRLTLGIRVDAVAVNAVAWSAVASPRVAAAWRWAPLRLRASLGRGFRVPSLAELYTSTAAQGIRVIPNPNLESESSWSGEVGVTVPAARRLVVDAALFWSEYWNLIEPQLVTGGTEIQFSNVTRARVRGLDLTARAAGLLRGHLDATLAYTWMDPRDLSLDLPLAFRPAHLATLSADWRAGLGRADTVSAGFDAHLVGAPARVEIFETDPRVPSRTVDLRASWRHGAVTVIARIVNVFDDIYTLVPRTLEPPRTYSMTVTMTQ
jgi:outer membrane receptor for ferrienterochelin and colicins